MLTLLLLACIFKCPLTQRVARRHVIAPTLCLLLLVSGVTTSADTRDRSDRRDPYDKRSDQSESSEGSDNNKVIREGTLVPPTNGQIIPVGRRWAFVPIEKLVPNEANQDTAQQLGGPDKSAMPDRSQRVWQAGTVRKRNPLRGRATPNTTRLVSTGNQLRHEPLRLAQIVIAENLMLQRIVEAIRADPADDHWQISGEVLEYFSDNRLVIRAAQRSSAARLPAR